MRSRVDWPAVLYNIVLSTCPLWQVYPRRRHCLPLVLWGRGPLLHACITHVGVWQVTGVEEGHSSEACPHWPCVCLQCSLSWERPPLQLALSVAARPVRPAQCCVSIPGVCPLGRGRLEAHLAYSLCVEHHRAESQKQVCWGWRFGIHLFDGMYIPLFLETLF